MCVVTLDCISMSSWKSSLCEPVDKDERGNCVMRCSRLSLTACIRYVSRDNIVYFNIRDLLAVFGTLQTESEMWESVPQAVRGDIYVYMHAFSESSIDEFDMCCLNFTDSVKLLMTLDMDVLERCQKIEIFLQYYVSNFHVEYKKNTYQCCDLYYLMETVIVTSFAFGVLLGCLLMALVIHR